MQGADGFGGPGEAPRAMAAAQAPDNNSRRVKGSAPLYFYTLSVPSPPSTVLRNEANSVSRAQIYLLAVAIGFVLYFYGIDRAGMLGPDEPRYASIGREMARSGDWVTPGFGRTLVRETRSGVLAYGYSLQV